MNLIIIDIELLARDIDLMEAFHIQGYFPSHQYKNVRWLVANPPAAPSLIGTQLRCTELHFI